MKRLFLSLVLCTTISVISAQFKAGFIGGISTFDVDNQEISIFNEDGAQEFALILEEGNYGYHLGIYTHFQLGQFFIRPEVVFNSNSADFRIFDEKDPEVVQSVFTEKYNQLDIPVLVGLAFGPLRLNAGPVGHVHLNSVSDLFDFQEYDQNFKTMTVGYQGGVGLDIWKISVDLRYEGNLDNFGDHIRFFGNEYAFSERPNRLMASVGYRF